MPTITCPRCGFHCPSGLADLFFGPKGNRWQSWCKVCYRRLGVCRRIAAQQLDTSNLWHAVIQQACQDAVGKDKHEASKAWRWLFRPNRDYKRVMALAGLGDNFFADEMKKGRCKIRAVSSKTA